MFVVPRDQGTLALLSHSGIKCIGTSKKLAGANGLHRTQERGAHGNLRSDHSIHEQMRQLLRLHPIAEPTGQRAGNFGSSKSRLYHRDPSGGDFPQELATGLMEPVSCICGGNPDTCINRQAHDFSNRLRSCMRSSRAEGPAGARETASSAERNQSSSQFTSTG